MEYMLQWGTWHDIPTDSLVIGLLFLAVQHEVLDHAHPVQGWA